MFPVPTRPEECIIVTLAEDRRESDAAFRTVRAFMESIRNEPPPCWPGAN